MAPVIVTDFETNLILISQHKAAGDFSSLTVDLLISDRLAQDNVARGCGQHQVSLAVNYKTSRPLKREFDGICRSAGSNLEVVFKLALVTVINKVNRRVHIRVANLRVCRNICAPRRSIIPDKVIGLARQLVNSCYLGRRVSVHYLHTQQTSLFPNGTRIRIVIPYGRIIASALF